MKQGWKIKKLGDIAYIGLGFTHTPEYVEKGVAFLSVKDISSGKICWDNIKYVSQQEYDSAPRGAKPSKGDIMFCRVGTMGKPVIIDTDLPFCTFVSLGYLHLLETDIINTYVKYWMQSNSFEIQVEANVKGIAIKNLNTGWLKTFDIPVPPREEQERIVAELDCLSGVIERKREQLCELDALAQSIFYQMFGDPITNEKGWEVNIIGNLAEFYNGVAHEGSISEDGQYDVINSKFISTQGEIRKHCDSQIFPLMKNDIVMVMSDVPNGKALAKCYLIETSDKYTLNQRICAFRNYNCFKPIFLYYYLNRHPYYLRFDDGNGQTNLRKNDVLNCPVYIPPLALQQEFADKIEAIEKQKELIKQSITQTEELFNARMDYYFN